MKNTTDVGNRGESFVCERIIKDGFTVIDRNIREKFAEIDIVAKEGETLCFIEVRTREHTLLGHPLETISAQKQAAIRRAAEAYLARGNITDCAIRFDVAFIIWSTMEYGYIRNAF
jgi:putative endonuclease